MDTFAVFMQENKKAVLGISGLVVIAIGAGVFYAYGEMSLLAKPASNTLQTTATTSPIVDLNQATSDAMLKKTTILLPKSLVTPAYYASYSAVVNEMIALQGAYQRDVTPLVSQAQTDIAKKDYPALATLGVKAQSINDTQKKRIAILSADFDSLAVSNIALTDATAKSLTTSFIMAGRDVITVYSSYSTLIDNVISGNLSAQSVTDVKTLVSTSATTMKTFDDAYTKLSVYFGDTLAKDFLAYLKIESSTKSR